MSVNIIDEEKSFGFTLTRFCGGADRGRMYQINEGSSFVILSPWQMLQLVCAFTMDAPSLPNEVRQRLQLVCAFAMSLPNEVKK